ncbi:hypothetical protein [uncultured Tenacibaculum sp.]|uniref:hypothetical protein n=1 Tax=uncultured Tenacibaculum sp. TaxID=174713 RepID=UPI00260E3F25|nr:hypothetical protein [uncultured Tenacibaculum sp.]
MYISPIDILDISLEDLEQIDKKNIIRLEKRLKVLKLQNQDEFYNLDEMHLLLEQLKDSEKRKSIIFIEKHPKLKEFISSGNDDGPSTFFFEEEFIEKLSEYSDFLAPYLDTYFFPLLKRDYQAKKYDTIIEALNHEEIFSSDLLLRCYKYLEQQTIILIETIKITKAKTLYEKCPQVTYDTHTDLLNLLPYGISDDLKLDYVNALVDYYNKSRINNKEYNKIKKAYRLFAKLSTSDSFVEDQFKDLASLGYQDNGLQGSGSNNFEAFRIFAFLIAVFIGIARFANNNSSSSNYNFDPSIVYERSSRTIDNLTRIYKKTQKDFIWNLYFRAKDSSLKASKNFRKVNLKTGDRGFKNKFDFYYDHTLSVRNELKKLNPKDSIAIINKSDKSLVLFTKYNEEKLMSTVFVNSKDSLKIAYETYLKLIYYLGKDFSKIEISGTDEDLFSKINPKDTEQLLKINKIYGRKDSTSHIEITNDAILYHKLEVETTANPDYIDKRKYNTSFSEIIETSEKEVSYDDYKRTPVKWNKPKNAFFNRLIKNSTQDKTQTIKDTFKTGQNLYPDLFRNYSHVDVSGYPVSIKNHTNKHLIIFNRNLYSWRDFTAYVKPHEELKVFLYDTGDSLYFYKGKHFYNNKGIPTLKCDKKEINFFSNPLIIQKVKGENPFIEINENGIEIIGLRY